jgi:ATP-dependent Lon protease
MTDKKNSDGNETSKKAPLKDEKGDGAQTVHEPEIILTPKALAKVEQQLPGLIFVLPVQENVLFPGLVLPLALQDKRDLATLEQARSQSAFLGIVTVRPEEVEDAHGETAKDVQGNTQGNSSGGKESATASPPGRSTLTASEPALKKKEPDNFYEIGCAGKIVQVVNLPGDRTGVMVVGLRRMRVKKWVRLDPVIIAEVDYPDETIKDVRESRALERELKSAFEELVSARPDMREEGLQILEKVEGPARLTDFVAGNLGLPVTDRQGLLATFEIDARLRQLLSLLERELDLARLGEKVRNEIKDKVEKHQRDFYLREQLKAIRHELGEEKDEKQVEVGEYSQRIEEAKMPPEAEKRAKYELKRLSILPQEAAEYHVIRTYLDWLTELPWSKTTEDNEDINRAEQILNEDHYGLEEVKERIVEFLAVRKLRPKQEGAILCLVGPPGVGKTSLGQSVARAMGRKFHRISLGGMRDEAEIRGHRRTYVGALPGRILQGLRRIGTKNPVFMLDEIDKLTADYRGDPSSALLEVLDPAQNDNFNDNYLEVPFDLSSVMFIATGNYAGRIPKPLYDRMEIITIPGYIPDEKVKIASRYLVPRQIEGHGLESSSLKIHQRALKKIVSKYTREAGVRELERRIARICRKVAADVARGKIKKKKKVKITPADLEDYLGRPKYRDDVQVRARRAGVAVGLAWTPFGGDVLFVEAARMSGQGDLQVTGKLGDVMSESAHIAASVVRANGMRWDVAEDAFRENKIHIHVPEGAVPKDGPSAGVTLATALVSLLSNSGRGVPIKARVAMTGELTLRGAVLPVGGIREKVVAAKRAGVRTVILPRANEPALHELPERVKKGLDFVLVEEFEEVLRAAMPARFVKKLDRRSEKE